MIKQQMLKGAACVKTIPNQKIPQINTPHGGLHKEQMKRLANKPVRIDSK